MCRSLGRVYFRRYLARAGQSPWIERARVHLGDLGDAAPRGADEIQVDTGAGVAPGAYIKAVLGAAPKLHACLGDEPLALYRLEMYLPSKNAGKPAKPVKPKPEARPQPIGKGNGAKQKKPYRPPPPPPPPPEPVDKVISVRAVGPEASNPTISSCLQRGLADIKWPAPAAHSVRVSFAVSAP
jgi:hypothetical protein